MKSSTQKKSHQRGKSPAPSTARGFPRGAIVVVVVLAVAGLVAVAVWFTRSHQTDSGSPVASADQTTATNTTAGATTAAQSKPDFQKLIGKWLRPDGGYVIEIKSAEDSGKLNAAYFNPKPINVFKAEASQEGAATKVFIELRDVNYPGSTYTLTYVADKDLLVGIYYQALQQQSFEVYFERIK